MMRTSTSQHRPQRTCVACRTIRAKQELIRIVRSSDGKLEVDAGGKRVGRGAYLCRAEECWETGLKGSRLEYALRSRLTPDNREQLIRYGKEHIQSG